MACRDVSRREFIRTTAAGSVAIAAGSTSAASYSRILGANDRITVGIVGCSARGRGALMPTLLRLENEFNVELSAVCDIWKVNLNRGIEVVRQRSGRTPRAFERLDDLLDQKDIDAVINATGDFQHAPLLARIAGAGRHCYSEKPMATSVEDAKKAVAAVKKTGSVVQIGTQGLSVPSLQKLKAFVETGRLGKISKVEENRSYWGPRWRGRSEPKIIREADTDWETWLLGKPARPFDPRLYFEYRIYRDFSTGIAGQWMSHSVAELTAVMGETFPRSVTADGGIFVWNDGRENPDTIAVNLTYPSGWLYSYSCSFGTNYPGYQRYYGLNGTIEGEDDEYVISGKGGGAEPTPANLDRQRRTTSSATGFRVNPNRLDEEIRITSEDETPSTTLHMKNWIECIRSQETPNADVMSGYYHSVACIMVHRSAYLGRKLYWDFKREEIVDSPAEV